MSGPAQKQRSLLITSLIIFLSFLASFSPVQAKIQITEIMPNPEEGSEWVELYNDSTQSANLTGWKIDDNRDGWTKTIDNLTINPGEAVIYNLSSSIFNNDSSDQARLFNPDNELVDQTDAYPAPAPKGLSWSLQEDGHWCFTDPSPNEDNNLCPEPSSNPTPTPSPTPTPTNPPSPLTTQTPTPTQTTNSLSPSPTSTPFALLTINQPKDESGRELNQVKVYLDEVYLHCYAPEELKFCPNCSCKTNSGEYGNCSFGHHTIKLVKTGYQDWIKEIEVIAGENQVINPQMRQLSDTPTPTPSPTSSPSPTPIYSPTFSPTTPPLPTLETKEASESTSGLILGVQTSSPSSLPSSQPTTNSPATSESSSPIIGLSLIIIGTSLIIGPFVFPDLIEKFKSFRNSRGDSK